MGTIGNVNHAVSIIIHWIFDSNYKKAFPLTIYSLNFICSPLLEEVILDRLETVFYAVRYIKNTWKLNIDD